MSARRASLRLLWGAGPRARHVIAPGEQIVVGRDAGCDLVLPHDPELSDRHFSVRWDGERGELRDERSRRGTAVGGEPVEGTRALSHGAWIRAAGSDLAFEVELPPRAIAPEKRALLQALDAIAAQRRLWAIVDAARGDRVNALLRAAMDPGRSLYEGVQGDALEHVAPHLLAIEPGSRLLSALIDEGWGAGWALFFESAEDERALRRTLRRLLVVEAEGVGPRTYFRFYDPAVLAAFWPMATARQRAELSRGIDAFWLPDGPHGAHRLLGTGAAMSPGDG